jgi:REP element-mobilizing transposase RayT
MGEMSDRFNVDIFAYVLMHNHYHILLRTNNPNLSRAMQWLGGTHTRRFNNRHARSGHLFQGRFKSLIVENDAYLVRLSCYIHRNPLRAGIVKRLIDHKWSSYPAYAYNRKHPEWLKTDIVLSQFGTDNPQLSYRKKVQRYSKEEASLFEELRYGLFFGTVGFADKLKSEFLKEAHPELPQQIMLLKRHDPEKLLRDLSDVLGCDFESFKKSLRIPEKDKAARDLMIYFLWQTGFFANRKISELFGLSYSSVSRRVGIFREKLRVDKPFKKKYDGISMLIKM